MSTNTAVKRGLKDILGYQQEQEDRKAAAAAPKATWFKLEKDKDSARVRFLQELDEDSPNFNATNDLGLLAVEHSNPKDYKRKALCTAGTGQCYPCEEHRRLNAEKVEDYKGGWKAKPKLYINVLVDNGKDAPFVAVLSQGLGGKHIVQTLLSYAEENGTITDKVWKITRSGNGVSDTSYTIFPVGDVKDTEPAVDTFDLFDVNTVVRSVDYADQPAHYGAAASSAPSGGQGERPAKSKADDVW